MIGHHLPDRRFRQSTIRPIEWGDDGSLARRFQERCQVFGLESLMDVDSLSNTFSAPRSRYFVVQRESRIAGGAGIAPLANDLDHIAELQRFVLEPMSGKPGVGVRLIRCCLEAADLLGYRACYVESFSGDSDLNEMLRQAGFRVFGEPLLKATARGYDAIHYFKLGLR